MLTQVQPQHLVQECHVCEPRGGCLGMILLDSEEAQQQLRNSKRINRKSEHVFREGEDADCFYVMRSFYLPGDVFGMDVTESQHRMSSAVSLETTSVCRFPHAFLSARSHGVNLLKITAEQMQRDHNLVLMLARKDADGRIAGFLDDLACRYWSRGYSASSFLLTMSRQDIGCYLGLAVETVSRTLTRFQDCGVLRVNRREVEILDHDTLRKIAGTQVCKTSPDCCKKVELRSV